MRSEKRTFFVFLTFSLLLALCASPGYSQENIIPVVIDTDMGLDDVRALFALLACDHLDIQGVVTVEGSASLGMGTDHLIGLMETIGRTEVPIFQGAPAPGLRPPPWRKAANHLGGNPFPPPRRIKAGQNPVPVLHGLLGSGTPTLNYLALGPLGNLARVETEYPGALQRIHTVWIPVRFRKPGELTAWNLTWDQESTKRVLSDTRRIVLIDLDSLQGLNTDEFFASVTSSTPAGTWIEKMRNSAGAEKPHLFLYDELAAAALIEQDLIEVGLDAWSLDDIEGASIRLHRDKDGNLFKAVFQEHQETAELLKACWNNPGEIFLHDDHDEDHLPVPVRENLRAFHGHLGPYVVLGYRMGKLALEKTGTEGHFDLSASVYSLLIPPPSCLIDGIQLGSGCTLGKRNIEVQSTEQPAHAVFEAANGLRTTIRLRPEIPSLVTALVEEKGVEQAGEIILEMDLDSLFEVEGPEKE